MVLSSLALWNPLQPSRRISTLSRKVLSPMKFEFSQEQFARLGQRQTFVFGICGLLLISNVALTIYAFGKDFLFQDDSLTELYCDDGLEIDLNKHDRKTILKASFTKSLYAETKFILKNEGNKSLLCEPHSSMSRGNLPVAFKGEALNGESKLLFTEKRRKNESVFKI